MPPTMPEGDYAPVPRQGWWGRNWKWAAPLGCLGMVGSCFCFAAIAVGYGYFSFKDSGALPEAVAEAQNDPVVQKELGAPIKSGFPSNMQVSTVNGRTHARFTAPLDGPKADGILHAEGDGEGDRWTFTTLTVELQDGRSIDLLDTTPVDRDARPELEPGDDDDASPEPGQPQAPLPPPEKKPGPGNDINL